MYGKNIHENARESVAAESHQLACSYGFGVHLSKGNRMWTAIKVASKGSGGTAFNPSTWESEAL